MMMSCPERDRSMILADFGGMTFGGQGTPTASRPASGHAGLMAGHGTSSGAGSASGHAGRLKFAPGGHCSPAWHGLALSPLGLLLSTPAAAPAAAAAPGMPGRRGGFAMGSSPAVLRPRSRVGVNLTSRE